MNRRASKQLDIWKHFRVFKNCGVALSPWAGWAFRPTCQSVSWVQASEGGSGQEQLPWMTQLLSPSSLLPMLRARNFSPLLTHIYPSGLSDQTKTVGNTFKQLHSDFSIVQAPWKKLRTNPTPTRRPPGNTGSSQVAGAPLCSTLALPRAGEGGNLQKYMVQQHFKP